MADGSNREIQDVKVGDSVLAFDEKTGQVVPSKVKHLLIHPDWKEQAKIVVINGSIHATDNHPVYVNGQWKPAGKMKEGDIVHSLVTGELNDSTSATISPVEVHSIEWRPGVDIVYNLEIADYHTYFAGGILVHNEYQK